MALRAITVQLASQELFAFLIRVERRSLVQTISVFMLLPQRIFKVISFSKNRSLLHFP
jgi:hypothetical protein